MDDYATYDAVGLAELVRARDVEPAELLAAARARTAEVNDRINAVVADVDPDRVDPDRADPSTDAAADGPFAGVPFLLKDLGHDLAGYPTSGGSRALATLPATENATVVNRWLASGLVVFGKTNTPEFGAKGITEPLLFGPCRNPWDLEHTPGGSSGGAAAAVAAGIVPCAAASDGGGSIRIPASACGLFGFKPSRGLVPAGPRVGESNGGTATDGVISRSVRDTAAMLDVLTGPTPYAPYVTSAPASSYAAQIDRDPGPLRIAVCTASSIAGRPDVEAVAAATGAGELLASLGHHVEQIAAQPFDDRALARDFLTTWFVHSAVLVAEAKERTGCGDSGFEPDTLVSAALGRATGPVDLVRAIEGRQAHVRRLVEFQQTYDLLLTPTTAKPPPRIGELEIGAALGWAQRALVTARGAGLLRFTPLVDQVVERQLGWVPYTQLANLTGRPAMSVPLHWTPSGLPIGVQLVGRLGGEVELLRLAGQLERARPWAERRPPI